jgi:hypothetical protein
MSTEQPDTPVKEQNIEKALKYLPDANPSYPLARLLRHASYGGRVSYEEAGGLLGDEVDEVLLLANYLRLLIPVRSTNDSMNWSDAVLLLQPGETYKMPNIARHLVADASITGIWDSEGAVRRLFLEMGEPDWNLIPALIRKVCAEAIAYKINGFKLDRMCREVGLGSKVGAMILELKGAGIISPKLDDFTEVQNARSPIYEVNRSLFPSRD